MELTRTEATVRTEPDIEAQPWESFDQVEGVSHKVLWRLGPAMAGLMRLGPGAAVPTHHHDEGHHHVYVTAGQVALGGRTMGPGAYAHVPAGVEHGLTADSVEGCTLLYLYLPS
jgi:quercetin dioxygenase-like cupin family protein